MSPGDSPSALPRESGDPGNAMLEAEAKAIEKMERDAASFYAVFPGPRLEFTPGPDPGPGRAGEGPPTDLAEAKRGLAETFAGLDEQLDRLAARGINPGPSQLTARLFRLAVPLPLAVYQASIQNETIVADANGPITILTDAKGQPVALLNPAGNRSGADSQAIATLIATAVNAAAGVRG